MAGKQISISADASGVKKSLVDIQRTAKEIGKSPIELMSPDTKKFLRNEAKSQLENLGKSINKMRSEMSKYNDQLKKAVKGSEKELEIKKKILEKQRQINDAHRTQTGLSDMLGGGGILGGPGGASKGKGKGFLGGILSKIPGLGLLGRMGPMGALAAGVVGAGAYGIGRARTGMRRFEEEIPDRIRLMGRGARDLNLRAEDRERYADMGLSQGEVIRRRVRAMDVFGKEGASQGGVLQRATFERAMGLEGGTMTGLGARLRPTVGGGGANQAVMKLQASLLASGIEDAIAPYLESATEMLSEINENGVLNQSEILGIMARVTKNNEDIPEQVARQFISAQRAMQTSTGEKNAFFQRAFATGDIGNKTLGATQAAISMGGLFGIDTSLFKDPKNVEALKALGITGDNTGFSARAGAILKQMNRDVGGTATTKGAELTSTQRLMRGFHAARMFNLQDPGQGMRFVERLEAAMGDPEKTKDVQKELEAMMKDPQLKNLEDIKNSGEGQINALMELKKTVESTIGVDLMSVNIGIRRVMLKVDQGISALATKLAPDEYLQETTKAQRAVDTAKRGFDPVTAEQVRGNLVGVEDPAAMLEKDIAAMQERRASGARRLAALKRARETGPVRDRYGMEPQIKDTERMIGSLDKSISIMTAELKKIAKATEDGNDERKKIGRRPPTAVKGSAKSF